MKKSNIDLTILVELKETGMSDKEIAEYLATQGINRAPVTISKILKKYYDSIRKKKPRKPAKPRYTDTIDINKLVELKEKGMSDKEIAEYLRGQGITRSESTIGKLLIDYYKSIGQEKPRKPREYRGTNPIDINKLVELKEKGMSDKEITEYLAAQGINRPEVSIGKIIKKYYDSIGKKKPRKPREYRGANPIDINKLVELKEKGMSDKEITEYLATQGIKRSETNIGKLLRDYYDSIGKYKPRKSRCIGTIDINELVKLKEKGMSDREISEYLRGQGIKRCISLISRYLREYYDSVGRLKPMKSTYAYIIDINELVELKENGNTDKEITEHLRKKGINISEGTTNRYLREYYDSVGRLKSRSRSRAKLEIKKQAIEIDVTEFAKLKELNMTNGEIIEHLRSEGINVFESNIVEALNRYNTDIIDVKETTQPQEQKYNVPEIKNRTNKLYNSDIEEILMRGMSIKEFISSYGEYQKEDEIREQIEKLMVVAEYSKKQDNRIIPDLNFIAVLDALKDPEEKIDKYVKSILNYMDDDFLEKGKLEEVRNMIFLGNSELMVYVFGRLNVRIHSGYDSRLYNYLKKEFQFKIRKYLERIKKIDDGRKIRQQENLEREINDD